jgi:hypothetical protein
MTRSFASLAVGRLALLALLGTVMVDPGEKASLWNAVAGRELRLRAPVGRFLFWAAVAMGYFHRHVTWRDASGARGDQGANAFGMGPGVGADWFVTESLAVGVASWIYRELYEYASTAWQRHVGIHWTVSLGVRFFWSRRPPPPPAPSRP